MAHAHPNGRGDQLLLGDKHLEVTLRIGLGELLSEGGGANLSVHCHYRWSSANGFERIAIGFAGRHPVPLLIGRKGDRHLAVLDGGLARLWLQPIDPEVADAAQLRDGALRHLGGQGLAVPALFVLDLTKALALDRSSDHDRRLTRSLTRLRQRSAPPPAIGSPWPSEPVATSTQGSAGVGWPCKRDPNLRKVSISSSVITPTALKMA